MFQFQAVQNQGKVLILHLVCTAHTARLCTLSPEAKHTTLAHLTAGPNPPQKSFPPTF